MQHWTITREADGLATLTFDKAGASTNTLSAEVLAELNEALDISTASRRTGSSSARARPTASSRVPTSTSSAT